MLGKRICCKWHGWVCRGWQDILVRGNTNDVGSVTSTGPLCMVGVNGASSNSSNGIFDEASLIDCVCVDCDLHVVCICNLEACINSGWCCAPIFMQFQASCARSNLLNKRCLGCCIPFA